MVASAIRSFTMSENRPPLSPPVNAAMVGLGRWGRNLVDAVQGRSDRIRFVAGVARTPASAADYARERGLTLTDDLRAVLGDPGIQAVVIATPHSRHGAQVRQAAAAGKHVYVEKPLALDVADAASAADACAATSVQLAVGFNRRFLPALTHLVRIVADGEVGAPLHLEGNLSGPGGYTIPPGHWRGSASENPAGGMAPRGSHIVDAMTLLCGNVEWVMAQSQRRVLDNDADDTTSALLRFESGVSASLVTLMATAETWRLRVLGSRGWAEMIDEHTVVVARLQQAPETRRFPPTDTLRAALEAFADAIAGGAPFPVAPSGAVHGVAVTAAIARSAQRGTRVALAEIA